MVRLLISNLGHEFEKREVFDPVNFAFDGARMSVVGPNGSGKSTLIKIIAGLLTPTRGEVILEIDGARIPRDCVRDVVGLVAPGVWLYGELTARENLLFLMSARGLIVDPHRIDDVLSEVGLTHRADDPICDLSSGLRQRASLAAALVHDPYVLLLDEPSTNLDKNGIDMTRNVIDRHSKRGIVVLATNDPDEAALGEASLDLGGPAR
ncbi:MAG: ABC transporter ATP-binding protein [Armatimonadota bacterium]|nr:ABC transporter ATP-binding protein [bacterium]